MARAVAGPRLVIGGFGKMGHWFVDFLGSQGYRVSDFRSGTPARRCWSRSAIGGSSRSTTT